MKRVVALLLALMMFFSGFSVFAQENEGDDSNSQPVTTEMAEDEKDSAEEPVSEKEDTESETEMVVPEFTATIEEVENQNVLTSSEHTLTVNASALKMGENALVLTGEGTNSFSFTPQKDGNYYFWLNGKAYSCKSDEVEVFDSKGNKMTHRCSYWYGNHETSATLTGKSVYTLKIKHDVLSDENVTFSIGFETVKTYKPSRDGVYKVLMESNGSAGRRDLIITGDDGYTIFRTNWYSATRGIAQLSLSSTVTYTISFICYADYPTITSEIKEVELVTLKEGDNKLTLSGYDYRYMIYPTKDGEFTFTLSNSANSWSLYDENNNWVSTSYYDGSYTATLSKDKDYYILFDESAKGTVTLSMAVSDIPLSKDGFKYTTNTDGTVNITGYQGESSDVVVPVEITNKYSGEKFKVKRVDSLTGGSVNLTSVKISEGIDGINSSLFYGYSVLSTISKIELPSSLTNSGVFCYGIAISDLSGFSKVKSLRSLSIGNCSSLEDISALSSLPDLTSLSITGNTKIKDYSVIKNLSFLASLSISNASFIDDSTIFSNFKHLTYLNISNAELTELVGLKNCSELQSVYFQNCKELKNVDGLKNLNDLIIIDLRGTKVTDQDAFSLLRTPENVTFGPANNNYRFGLKTTVYPAGYNGTQNYHLVLKETNQKTDSGTKWTLTDITDRGNTGWKITGVSSFTADGQLYYEDQKIDNQSLRITYDATVSDPAQKVGESVVSSMKDTAAIQNGAKSGVTLFGRDQNNTLWQLSGTKDGKTKKILPKVKSYAAADVYTTKGLDTWVMIRDDANTLYSAIIRQNETVDLYSYGTNIKEYCISQNYSSDQYPENYIGYGLTEGGVLYLLSTKAEKLCTNVKAIAADNNSLAYLTNDGELHVRNRSQEEKDLLIDSDVNSLYSKNQEIIYQKKDGTNWYLAGIHQYEYTGETKTFWVRSYLFKAENGVTYQRDADDNYVKIFDFEATAIAEGRTVTEDGQTHTYVLISDGSQLWEVSAWKDPAETVKTKKYSSGFRSFGKIGSVDGYVLTNGNFYNVEHKLIASGVKEMKNGYWLDSKGNAYYGTYKILTNVCSLSNTTPMYMIRTDGSIWIMPENGTLHPFKLTAGDVNQDGTISIMDARLAKRIAMKDATAQYKAQGMYAGDFDGNGKITINEARKIKRAVLKETTL